MDLMFDHEIAGKQAVIVLHEKALEKLKPLGVAGSPLYAKVLRVDRGGLWLDNPAFPVCPADRPRLYDASGKVFCRAHVYLPAEAIVALAAFPDKFAEGQGPDVPAIGFRPVPRKARRKSR